MANLSFSFSTPTPGIEDVVIEFEFKILTSRIVLVLRHFIHVLFKNPQKKHAGILYDSEDQIQWGLIFVVDCGQFCPCHDQHLYNVSGGGGLVQRGVEAGVAVLIFLVDIKGNSAAPASHLLGESVQQELHDFVLSMQSGDVKRRLGLGIIFR